MKKILLLTTLLLAVVITACSSSSDDAPENVANITLSQEKLFADGTGATLTVTVTSDKDWFAYTYDDWFQVSKDGNTLSVVIPKNESLKARTGKVYVKAGSTLKEIPVTQSASKASDLVKPVAPVEGYNMVWNDEFDGSSLSTSKWTFENWEVGTVNNELQAYVSDNNVAQVSNGMLNITCKKVDGKIISARLYANRNTGWTYGYFEARMKLPSGKGTWPAFWMMPVVEKPQWPGSGEIDIMEEVGSVPNEINSTIHTTAYNHTKGTQKTNKKNIGTAETDFHVYSCEWTKDVLNFYIDGEQYFSFKNDGTGNRDTWPFDKPFYIILNLAFGGSWGGQNGVDESVLPATYQIDYVRVFQKK